MSQSKFATIDFEGLERIEQAWGEKMYYFKINDRVLTPSNKKFKVKLNDNGLDTFMYSSDSTFENRYPIFTKFRQNETYSITINSCSIYTLVAANAPKMGSFRFMAINIYNNSQIYGGLCTSDSLIVNVPTKYYEPCQSAMCFYSPVEISVSDGKQMLDLELYHCLHGEKILAVYDGMRKKITLKVDK